MKNLLLCFGLILGITQLAFSQDIFKLKDLKPHEEYENILIKKLYSDNQSTSFVIWVKDNVKAHYHAEHTEQLFILEGKGKMTIGEQTSNIKKGDYFVIPKGVPHSVTVIGRKPLKVLSVQSPEFVGKDRVFVKNEN